MFGRGGLRSRESKFDAIFVAVNVIRVDKLLLCTRTASGFEHVRNANLGSLKDLQELI